MEYRKSITIGGNDISVSLLESSKTCDEADSAADFNCNKNKIRISILCPDGERKSLDFLNESL